MWKKRKPPAVPTSAPSVGTFGKLGWQPVPGVKLLRTLAGHKEPVTSVAFDPQGRTLASCSYDNTVKLWESATGKLLRTFAGHQGWVFSMAFDPQGRTLASGGNDNTVKLWKSATGTLLRTLVADQNRVLNVVFDPQGWTLASGGDDNTVKLWESATGTLLRTLAGHEDWIRTVAFDPQGRTLASGSDDNTVKLWESATGTLLRTLAGHQNYVLSVAFDPQGRTLASGSDDNTVKLWESATGTLLRTLEGHTAGITAVPFSADGRLLASQSEDHTIRLWNCETWETVAIIQEPTRSGYLFLTLAFHPTLPLLATVGSAPDTPEDERGQLIHLWELDLDVLLGKPPTVKTVQYRNAKIVLVGDTGVGKSALAERLVRNEFVQGKSTHARRTLVLDSQTVPTEQGREMHHETVLWDLAGQPAYRLVHQLSLDDAAVACVLFDARSETNPFEGAAYWSQVLQQAKTNVVPTKLLVASRVDVGGLPASPERIQAFAQEHGFDQVFQTSAFTGEGREGLLAAIRDAIDWDHLPAVSSSETLAQLREFVSRLKGERRPVAPRQDSRTSAGVAAKKGSRTKKAGSRDGFPLVEREGYMEGSEQTPALMTIAELQRRFEADVGKTLPLDEFLAYLKRLEDSDVIDLLIFHTTGQAPRPEDQVLLDPTRVDAYASALLVAAKDEPDGPGHLLESRVHEGNFKLEQSERLSDKASEKHVLWYVMENLFTRDLALREPINGQDYVVFPAQCTSPLTFPGGTAFGVAFGMAGPVRSIYATLIAQLAHYQGFVKREFFQDAAAYHSKMGHRCLVRLHDHGNGTGELQVSFDEKTKSDVRQGFLEFVEKHVDAKAVTGSFTKRHAYQCQQCLEPFDDKLVKGRLEARRSDLLCPHCEARTPLVNLLAAPTAASIQVAETIDANAKAGRQRITAEWVIKGKKAQGKYDVFLSYNSKDKLAVEEIAKKLLSVGIRPWLDQWDLSPGDSIRKKLEWAIQNIHCAALFFGPADTGQWHILEIDSYIERWASGDARMVPVILPNAPHEPAIPLFVKQTLWVNLRDWKQDGHDGFYRLVCGILGRQPGDSPLTHFKARDVWDWQQPN